MKKYIGVILAITTLLLVFISNALLYMVGVDVNLSINPLPYYINLPLFILVVIFFRSLKKFHERPFYLMLSVFLLQNLFISTMDGLIYRLAGFESHQEGASFLIIPIVLVGVVIWGVLFDKKRNKILGK